MFITVIFITIINIICVVSSFFNCFFNCSGIKDLRKNKFTFFAYRFRLDLLYRMPEGIYSVD